MASPVIISFSNQKGGVGKTTSAVNIAACVASKGRRVLLADMDPQGNATSGVGINKKNLRCTMYDLLLGKADATHAVIKTSFKNLSVIPSNINLAGAEFDLIDIPGREYTLKNALSSVNDDFDYIIIDCPPSLSLLTVNSLSCSTGVVIPMQCEFYALEGLTQLMYSIKKVKQLYNRELSITGILITMYNGRLNLTSQVIDELKKYYSDKLFKTPIARNVKLCEAPSFGTPIIYHDQYSKGSQAYLDVTDELLERTC